MALFDYRDMRIRAVDTITLSGKHPTRKNIVL